MSGLSLAQPWWLAALPLALLPLWRRPPAALRYSSLALLPADAPSRWIDRGLRAATALAVTAIVLALAGPYRPPQPLERLGEGAQIVLLLDRSRSMDEPFASGARPAGHTLSGENRRRASKGVIARDLLGRFAASRHDDLFAMVAFSTYPIPILPLTSKADIVQAAINAGHIGKGLSETDVGAGLLQALRFFHDRPYTGSRIVLLVSDGGARLDLSTQIHLKNAFRRYRAALYWIYIRSRNSPGLDSTDSEAAPEADLHRFFQAMNAPYRVYTAEDPQALEDAIADVNRLQTLPLLFADTLPRRDLSGWCYGAALLLTLLLLAARLITLSTWR